MQEQKRRVIVVSNRLPFTIKSNDGKLSFSESVGGLATGLRAYLTSSSLDPGIASDYVWIGWPGSSIAPQYRADVKEIALREHNSFPVFLEEQEIESFYQGFCNKTLWPLFHYFPAQTRYEQQHWQQYVHVNESFCDTILDLAKEGDLIWIHDYHLLLLPQLLRQRNPDLNIGFFLHIPFPTFEIFRLLPGKWRRALLEGLLGADLVGFHTFDYLQSFLRCTLRILGLENQMGQLSLNDRIVRAASFPMGIDFRKFHDAARQPSVEKERKNFSAVFGNRKTVLSVDRLDYSKGIAKRLEGFETMLENHEEWREKVTLLMVVVPSRVGIDDYDLMKKQIEEIVGRVNGKFGTIDWTPVIYQYKSFSFEELTAMYSASDVALVTPLRDGMNLVAKEYIASRVDSTGVLILSEMAGAAKELGEAIIINPNNREEIAEALLDALLMPVEEQVRRNTIMQRRLRRYDVVRWASDFLRALVHTRTSREEYYGKVLRSRDRKQVLESYCASQRRLILTDYDGTLSPFFIYPHAAKPSMEVVTALRTLASEARNMIVLISGRDKSTLDKWFGDLPIGLVAEHGIWIRDAGADWHMPKLIGNDWKPRILPMLENYADRLPGAFVEEKEYSVVWHFRAADPEAAKQLAQELTDDLLTFTKNTDVQILQGNKIIEVRSAGVHKGNAALHFLRQAAFDFVLALGDDWTDEDLFPVLPENAISIRVGIGRTRARFNLRNPHEAVRLLDDLVSATQH